MTNKNYFWFTVAVSFCSLILAHIYAANQIVTENQWYLYLNALDTARNGNFQLVGEIIPGIGPTVGSIGNVLTAFPLLFSDSPWFPMEFIIILRYLSFIFFSIGLRKFFSNKTLCCFNVIYLLSPWFLFETTLSQSSYVIFFVSIIFLSICSLKYFNTEKEKNFLNLSKNSFINQNIRTNNTSNNDIDNCNIKTLKRNVYSFLLVFALGLSLQLSYLSICLIIMVILLAIRRVIHINLYGAILGIIAVASTMGNFVNSLFVSDDISLMFSEIEQEVDIYSFENILTTIYRGVFGWLRLGSTAYSHHMVKYFDASIISQYPVNNIIYYLVIGIWYILGAVTLLINLGATVLAIKYTDEKFFSLKPIKEKQSFFVNISLYAFFALILSALILPLKFQVINSSTLLVFAALPIMLLIELYNEKLFREFLIPLMFFISFSMMINIVGATNSTRFSAQDSLDNQFSEIFEDINTDIDLNRSFLEESTKYPSTNQNSNNTEQTVPSHNNKKQ